MNTIDESAIIYDYVNETMGIESICSKYKIGKLRVKGILKSNNIPIRPRGGVKSNTPLKVENASTQKYDNPPLGFHYVAVCKEDKKEFEDYANKSGCLTNYIKDTFNIEIPSLFRRHSYYKETGNYWYEQWFDIVLKEDEKPKETKKCPYCDWETVDVNNRSGVFEQHLKKVHGMSVEEHLEKHVEDKEYFTNQASSTRRKVHETDESKYVTCQICGKKFARLDWKHLNTHGITSEEYKRKYGIDSTLSKEYRDYLKSNVIKMNLALEDMPEKFTSKAETEIREFITSLGYKCVKNRAILKGKELDMVIPQFNLAIEFNGNMWHTENFGHKDRYYHLNKLNECNAQKVNLIQIFEDEYVYHKDIVLNKIQHLIYADYPNKERIMGRKCEIKEISNIDAWNFLDKNHIQGKVKSTVYIGAYYNNFLIGVTTFLNEGNNKWNLTRLATSIQHRCQGVASKMFNYFVKNYNPDEIKSFADRRWTICSDYNLYTQLGFTLTDILKPDYRYYAPKLDRYKRFHKFGFRKQLMSRKFGFNPNMTESEMAKELKLDKIWDCGLFKYVWKKKKAEE